MKFGNGIIVFAFLFSTACAAQNDGSISVNDVEYPAYKNMAEATFAKTKGNADCGFDAVGGDPNRVIATCTLAADDKVCAWVDGGEKCFDGPANGRVVSYARTGSGMQVFWRFEATDREEVFEFDDLAIGLFAD